MKHIPNDIYEQIVDHVRDNSCCDRKDSNYSHYDCHLSDVQFESRSDKGLIVEVDGWVSVTYYESSEIWGIDSCCQGSSSCLSCKTWDEDGNEVANDFNETILNKYFKN